MPRKHPKEKFIKFGGVLISLFIISLGTIFLFSGQLFYRNYWGGMVFPPFTIFIGCFMLYALLFKWNWNDKSPKKKVPKAKSRNHLISIIAGMAIGLMVGVTIAFNLDNTKGWNPYGWWFPVSFLSTVFCGLLGPILYEFFTKKQRES